MVRESAREGAADHALPGRAHRLPKPTRAQGHQTSTNERMAILAIAVLAGVVGAFSTGQPTRYAATDLLFRAGAAAIVTLAASRARRWTWLVLAGFAAVASPEDGWLVVTGAALVFAFVTTISPRRRLFGAIVGACAVQGLLRATDVGFGRASVVLVVLAVTPVLISAYAVAPRRVRRRVHWGLGIAGGFAVVATVLFGIAAVLAATAVNQGARQAKAGLIAARDGKGDDAAVLLDEAAVSFTSAHELVDAWWVRPAGMVPVLAPQVEAIEVVTGEGSTLTGMASGVASQADIEELKYTNGRIDIDRLRSLRDPLTTTASTLERAVERIGAVRSAWLVPPLADRVDEVYGELTTTLPDLQLAAAAATQGPDLLGAAGTRHYLVLFTQPSEARGLGGFVGNWAELTASDGRLDITRSGRARDINDAPGRDTRVVTSPPVPSDYVGRYGRFRPAAFFQDVTLSPDLPSVAAAARQIYAETNGMQVDGVLVVDPYALAALLQFTGPLEIDGFDQTLTPDNAAEVLVRSQYTALTDTTERTDFLDQASKQTFEALVHGSLPSPKKVAEVLGPIVDRHRLSFHVFDNQSQPLFDRLKMGGAMPTPDGRDFLQVVTQNNGNNKIDMFLHRRVDYEATFDPATGAVEATLKLTLRNDAPSEGLPPGVIGSNDQALPPGTNRAYVSVYSPLGLREAKIGEARDSLEFQHELGYSVYSRYVDVPAGATIMLELNLFGQVEAGPAYRLQIRAQPLVNADEVNVRIRADAAWEIVASEGLTVEPSHAAARVAQQPDGDLHLGVELAQP